MDHPDNARADKLVGSVLRQVVEEIRGKQDVEQPVPYCAYLIRPWPTKRRSVADYRISLQCVANGQRKNFSDLDSLHAFLQAQAEEKNQVVEA